MLEKGLITPSTSRRKSVNEITVSAEDEFGFVVGQEYIIMRRQSGENVGNGTYKTYMGAHPIFRNKESVMAAAFKPSKSNTPWEDDYRTLWFRPFHLGPDGQYIIIPK